MGLEDIDLHGRSALDDELRRNQEAGLAPPEVQPSSLGDLAHAASRGLGLRKPESIDWNPLRETINATSELFDRIGVLAPSEQELLEYGTDLERVETAYKKMEQEGLEPQLVLAPILPLDGTHGWQTLFERLSKDTTIQNNPLKPRQDGIWLETNYSIKRNWNRINYHAGSNKDGSTAHSARTTNTDGGSTAWQLSVLPATATPPEVNIPRNNVRGYHPTVSNYLTMQAALIQAGETPIDNGIGTWLAGDIWSDSGVLEAPFGCWEPLNFQISLGRYAAADQSNALGSRLAVRG